ncbi:hypothetical protein [Candidatus Nitrospira nitrificans]|uniref:DUF5666 domain-containing protein n=1 Tax=Candidatus Nitrospira nitrificans TaxID=1742973 RepID=A0A0S4LS26_9BACT|nr:hypothetical protein [Candidatus Nitrospira nitrificans]CUS39758.1 exported hypothetical protein [Candidatus Nitrospira nitrificans]
MRAMWRRWLGTAVGLVLLGGMDVQAATEPSTIAPGGGKSPVTGGRPDEQNPRLGLGNRGTGEPGRPLIDPSRVRSKPSGPGTIKGQVLSIQGETFIVRESDGHEVILKSTKDTEMPSMIQMGETVEATVDSAGIPTHIKPSKR